MANGIFLPIKPGSQNSIFTAAGLFLASTWITLSLRIWVRCALVKSFGWDDAILLLSAVTFTGFCAVIMSIETVGGAEHIDLLGFEALTHTVGMVVAVFGLYIATMVFFKISLGIFYLRFIIRSWQRYVVYITVVINSVYGLLLFLVAIFQCGDPTQYLVNELRGICMPNGPLYGVQLVGAIINATTDWALAILPIFVLIKANMPKPAKISAGFILLLGCSGSIISLIRIQYIKDLRPSPYFFRSITDLAIWSIAECGICISAAAAAALRPLFRGLMERTGHSLMQTLSFGSRLKSGHGSSNNARQSEALFGDWVTHTARHQMADVESQNEPKPSMSTTTQNTSQNQTRDSDSIEGPNADIKASTKRARSNTNERKDMQKQLGILEGRSEQQHRTRPDFPRNRSIREKGISRPVPHNSRPMVPPTPTFGTRPQPVLLVDARRRGSPDWIQTSNLNWPPGSHSLSPLSSPTGRPF